MSSSSLESADLHAAIARGSAEVKSIADGSVSIPDDTPRRRRKAAVEDDAPVQSSDPSKVTWGVKTFGNAVEGSGLSYDEAASLWARIYHSGTPVLLSKE